MANLGLERALEKSGMSLARTAVGDRYVLEEMQRIRANLGGEQSGHILFLDDAHHGRRYADGPEDGISRLHCGATRYADSGPENLPSKNCERESEVQPPFESLAEVHGTLKKAEAALGNSGRVVLRYSGQSLSLG